MTRVLVAYATKMGGTKEIAEAIGDVLGGAGLVVEVHDAQHVQSTAGFDAVVIGSAIYISRWRPEAVRLPPGTPTASPTGRPLRPGSSRAGRPVPTPRTSCPPRTGSGPWPKRSEQRRRGPSGAASIP